MSHTDIRAPSTDGRVLPPAAGQVIEAAFGRMAPDLVLAHASIAKTKVTAKACAPTGACVELELTDPLATCAGTLAGPWCLTWKSAPPQDIQAKVQAALAVDAEAAVWSIAKDRPDGMPPPSASTPTFANGDMRLPVDATALTTPLEHEAGRGGLDDATLMGLVAVAFAAIIAAVAVVRARKSRG